MQLTFIGDIFPADELLTQGFGILSQTTDEQAACWTDDLRRTVGQADYIIGNLESPLVASVPQPKSTFCGAPRFATLLKEAGVNVLHVANNHMLEHGPEGYRETLGVLQREGIEVVGGMLQGEPAIVTLSDGQSKVCVAGFCDETICHLHNPGLYAPLSTDLALRTLRRMQQLGADVIIFTLHWGNEYIHLPSPRQRALARTLIDHGAHLIVGHHPHVVQPYEHYGAGHIFYSLGNFCFDALHSAAFATGMLAKVQVQQGRIEAVQTAGVGLCDVSLTEHLVRPLPPAAFSRHFDAVQAAYARCQRLDDAAYAALYHKRQRRIHLQERLRMKWNLLADLLRPHHRYRRRYLKNLVRYVQYVLHKKQKH